MSSEFDVLEGNRMNESAIDRLLVEAGVGTLSMADGDVPYGIPLSFGYDGDDRLYFVFVGHSTEGRKESYAEASEVVSFLVYDVEAATEWRSAIVAGTLERITPEEWDRAREAMADNAFRPQLLTDVDRRATPNVWVLDAEEKTGRAVGLE
jgi:nitroimidazol reductase NimA-like FMN-containing flavoprotein (pyridoxamine 5'-phosphate oxidase superfamily)